MYKDIDLGNLLADPVPVIADILDPMLGELPWKLMHWESFQKLCAQLIQRQYIGCHRHCKNDPLTPT
ncbi:hypothetical protein I5591_01945 [Pseudomonas syringae pv. tomato]|nr:MULTISPECIES: hypothetical protein [Pseudomonas syringae group]MBH0138594.1 hypothetical protein [Pseudomonas syringae pv. tomato]MBM1212117.1 hypothetical protein [Pseudomonas syringae]MBM1217860.1 hypothetical protein [Pseudomonas syringae]MEA1761678.1 hypothetical protein [Pseudomonas syringae pv. tomato]TES63365.1 hypothetical protein E2N90_27330 [Pseudomonas syringae pv. tomato]